MVHEYEVVSALSKNGFKFKEKDKSTFTKGLVKFKLNDKSSDKNKIKYIDLYYYIMG